EGSVGQQLGGHVPAAAPRGEPGRVGRRVRGERRVLDHDTCLALPGAEGDILRPLRRPGTASSRPGEPGPELPNRAGLPEWPEGFLEVLGPSPSDTLQP